MKRDILSKILKTSGKSLFWICCSLVILLIILEIVLSGPVLTRIVNGAAADYVDGELKFGKARVSLFRRFPAVTLTLEDVSLTYPAERFDSLERVGAQGHLMHAGCSDISDTLASFNRFSVGLSVPALMSGTIKVPYMRLDKPRIFAHTYADGSVNWDMFILGESSAEEESADTAETSGGLPKIVIGKVMMTGKPHIVYTDSRDTIFAVVGMKRLALNGKIDSRKVSRSRLGVELDSLFVAGRVSRDTLAAGIDRLHLHENGKSVDIDMASKAFIATREYGRIRVPMNVAGTLDLVKDSIPAVNLSNLNINIAHIPLSGNATLRFMSGKTGIKADLSIDKCKIETLLHDYASHIIPEAGKVSTDAVIDLKVTADGVFDHNTGKLPQMAAVLSIPDCGISYQDFPDQMLKMGFKADAEVNKDGRLDLKISRMNADLPGIKLSAVAGAKDILGSDPDLDIDGTLLAELGELNSFLPDSLGIEAGGNMSAMIKGGAKLSQLDIYNFSSSSLTGELKGDSIVVNIPKDTISAVIDGLKIKLGPEQRVSRRDSSKVMHLVGISGEIAKADIKYTDAISLKAEGFKVSAKNSTDSEINAGGSRKIHPFRGTVGAGKLTFRDADGTTLRLTETSNSFNIFPKKGLPSVPVLSLTSRNKRISFRYDANRGMMTDANLRISAAMNTFEKRNQMKAFMDSLAKVYPYVPKDSLLKHHMTLTRGQFKSSFAIKEDDFKEENIDISLDRSLAKHFREWEMNGKLAVGKSLVMTPLFPLRNTLSGFELSFNNDRVGIDSLALTSGESDLSVTGELTGLRRALLGRRGSLKLDAEITSEKMNANQLLAAYTTGMNFTGSDSEAYEDIEDEAFMQDIELDSSAVSAAPALIVVPGNLNADISLAARNIDYSDLHIDLMTADLIMKDRCVQISNTRAQTNMGEIDMEGFYATRSKKDIKAGFSLNFKDITAEKVINLMPSIDTLMPLLKSFGGMLDCELAATAQLDTSMNLIMPSINGIMRIGGEDLYVKDNDLFKRMAKLLVFKDKKEGHIDRMTVEGIIKDSKVEVFPFIVEMDRYMLGLSGVQNMDMSFRYHASLIKSPFLIKVGMDVYGEDFDNMKFKIGRPKYKSRNVPVFSAVIDDTKINLVESMRNVFDKGVDAIMRESAAHRAIEEHKKKIGYVQAVDQKTEELSAAEQKQLEAEQQTEDTNGQLPDQKINTQNNE